MATNSSVAITPGAGANVDLILLANGDAVQTGSERRASASTTTAWTVSLTAAVVVTGSPNNVSIRLTNVSGNDVYVGQGTTTVTAILYSFTLLAGAIWEAPPAETFLSMTLLGKIATGQVMVTVGTEV